MYKILSLFDFPLSFKRWTDPSLSMSWLDTFRELKEIERYAYVCCNDFEVSELDLDGVKFTFSNSKNYLREGFDFSKFDLIIINFSYYDKHFEYIKEVKVKFGIKVIVRIHHEPFRLVAQSSFVKLLSIADFVISPLLIYNDFLKKVTAASISTLPFGVDVKYFSEIRSRTRVQEKSICVAFSGNNPVKNLPLAKSLFKFLSESFKVDIISGVDKSTMGLRMASCQYFFQPSLSEASGSRVLYEAISAGCIPVTLSNANSASYVVRDCGGIVIDFSQENIFLKGEQLTFGVGDISYIARSIKAQLSECININVPMYLSLNFEVVHFARILHQALNNTSLKYDNITHIVEDRFNSSLDRLSIGSRYSQMVDVDVDVASSIGFLGSQINISELFGVNSIENCKGRICLFICKMETWLKRHLIGSVDLVGTDKFKLIPMQFFLARVADFDALHYQISGDLFCYFDHFDVVPL